MSRNDFWTTPPGGTRAPRRVAKTLLTSFIVGVLSVGMAWAGVGLTPVSTEKAAKGVAESTTDLQVEGDDAAATAVSNLDLSSGQILAGAAKISLHPRPEDYQAEFPGARWEQDQTKCEITGQGGAQAGIANAGDTRVKWPENPDCIYMGGYGIGPMNAISTIDPEYGLWVRSVAMQDAQGDAVVVTLIDTVYWQGLYDSMCPGDPCGFLDLAQQLADETGLKPESFIFTSSHAHTAPDFIGGWGGVPDWYMQQATDSLKASVKGALASMEPAVLEAGEEIVRARNAERRDYYRSAEEDGLSWFRLIDADDQPRPEVCTTPTPTPAPTEGNNGNGGGNGFGNQGKETPAPAPEPTCEPAAPGRAIATVGAYAAHPVTEDEGDGEGDADFSGVFAQRVEEAYGGVGMFLQTGLGNMSPRGNKVEMGGGLAAAIPAIGGGSQVTEPDVRVGRKFWDQPATNVPLSTLGAAGFFDRTFNRQPAAINVGKASTPNQKCSSASPLSVRTSVSAAKVGSLWITAGPGELFSSTTNTFKERNPNGVTLPLAVANDALGYIIPEYETDYLGRQGTGFVGGPVAEYEDAYSIDHCIGDATTEYTIELLGQL